MCLGWERYLTARPSRHKGSNLSPVALYPAAAILLSVVPIITPLTLSPSLPSLLHTHHLLRLSTIIIAHSSVLSSDWKHFVALRYGYVCAGQEVRSLLECPHLVLFGGCRDSALLRYHSALPRSLCRQFGILRRWRVDDIRQRSQDLSWLVSYWVMGFTGSPSR